MAVIVDQKKFSKSHKPPIFIETDQMRHNRKMELNKAIIKRIKAEDPKFARELKHMKKKHRYNFLRSVRNEMLKGNDPFAAPEIEEPTVEVKDEKEAK